MIKETSKENGYDEQEREDAYFQWQKHVAILLQIFNKGKSLNSALQPRTGKNSDGEIQMLTKICATDPA